MLKLIVQTYKRVYRLLPSNKRKHSILILFLLGLSSTLDLAGLGALLPLFIFVLDPEALSTDGIFLDVFNALGFDSETNFIIFLSSLIFLIVLVKNLIGLFIHYLIAKFTFSVQEYFSNLLLFKYFHRGLTFIKESNSNRVARDVNGVPGKFSTNLLLPLMNMTNELILICLVVLALFLYNPWVVLLVLAVVLPTFLLFYSFSKNRVQYYAEKIYEISPRISKVLYESFFGYVDIKVSGTEDKFRRDYQRNLRESVKYQVLNQTFKQAPTKVVETSMILGILIIICFGLFYYSNREALLTLLSVFALAAYRLIPSANRLMVALIDVKAHQYSIEVLNRVNTNYPEEDQKSDRIKFENRIQFKNVNFSFTDGQVIIDGIDLELKKGERLGVIGQSGSGKSTLMNLLLLFYEPNTGSILCDEQEIGISSQKVWRKLIGYVPQEVFLNDGNIRENVAFGVSEESIDDKKVIECLERASLAQLVESLEKGIYSSIGERGSRLSGGQRQRIGIARALYFGAQILLFDEATSALDSATEREITDSIAKLAEEDMTMLIIAHRTTSLKHCNRIIELEEGKIKAEHQYDSLIKEYH